jgi:hypothetical protein
VTPIPDGFQLYEPGFERTWDSPRVSILKKGMISFNEAAFRALNQPEAIQLYFNPEQRVIGIGQTMPDHPTAIPVRTQAGTRSYLASCAGFLKFAGIDYGRSRQYRAERWRNLLTVDLKEAAAG